MSFVSNDLRAPFGIAMTLGTFFVAGCILENNENERCGPSKAKVTRVLDGDTVEIEGGEIVRYLLIDTPELSSNDCYAVESTELNESLVLGKTLDLEYDEVCRDKFDRLLAYVTIGDRSINETLLERGYACTLFIPPNGADRIDDYQSILNDAKNKNRGMWSQCESLSCS